MKYFTLFKTFSLALLVPATLAVDHNQVVFDLQEISNVKDQLLDALVNMMNSTIYDGLLEFLEEIGGELSKDNSPAINLTVFEDYRDIVSSGNLSDSSLGDYNNNPKSLGVDTVDQYSGYIDINETGKHMFYWFFESRNDPATDPIIIWLSGGPGCASTTGLFFELGPSTLNSKLQPIYNPYSWNSNASVIFLDQPIDAGFSFTTGEEVKNTRAAAKDVYMFLELFFQKFPQFLKNKFHIASESYGGHFVPAIATEIFSHPERSFELSSVLIGNAYMNPLVQYTTLKPFACGEYDVPAVVGPEVCEKMEKGTHSCSLLQELCYKIPTSFGCRAAQLYCQENVVQPYLDAGRNFFDIRKEGWGRAEQMDWLEDYLNSDHVKAALGVDVDKYTFCSANLQHRFLQTGDGAKGFQNDLAALLDRDVPVLMYAGDKDFICNFPGVSAVVHALEYKNQDKFGVAKMNPWVTSEGDLAGEVKNYENFTFVKVYNASHQAPQDEPKNCLDMLNTWLQGNYTFGY